MASPGSRAALRNRLKPSEYALRNFAITTSGLEDPQALLLAIDKLGVDRVMWVARDITASKHAEAALQKSEEKFRNLFDDAPIAIGLASVRDFLGGA